jgi:hypothetical protein
MIFLWWNHVPSAILNENIEFISHHLMPMRLFKGFCIACGLIKNKGCFSNKYMRKMVLDISSIRCL